MRILIVSDIHSNLVALETVLHAAGSYDTIWCLGDTIGYGPRPNECITHMRQANEAISGNHDLACIGHPEVDLNDFNPDARDANRWNGEQLTDDNRTWLSGLAPLHHIEQHPQFMLAHGSPRDPVWEYLLSLEDARANFDHTNFPCQVCFIGHSHVPIYYVRQQSSPLPSFVRVRDEDCHELYLEDNRRYIINPGSVGQPRDQSPRAAYGLLDTDAQKLWLYRISYDIRATQRQMAESHLPSALIRRLSFGI